MLQKKLVTSKKSVQFKGLQIQKSHGQPSIYRTSWVIIGLPGVGKSTLASGFDGVLFLCTSEKEVGRLNVDYIVIDSWEKVLNVTDELLNNRESYKQYKFIAIDFIDAVWTMCIIATCQKLGIEHTSDAAYGKGIDTVDQYFKKWITTLVSSDYGLLFISHVQQKDVIVRGGTVTKTICTLSPRARMAVFPLVNVIGCMEYRTIKVTSPSGKVELQIKRVISFEANEYIEAKDRDGVLPSELVLYKDPKKNFELFKQYYDGVKSR